MLRRDYGEAKEEMRGGGGGKRLGSYVGIGSCAPDAQVAWDGVQIGSEALGVGDVAQGQELQSSVQASVAEGVAIG